MPNPFQIRPYQPADAPACGEVYFDAVRNGTAPHYSAEQACAWAPERDPAEWVARLATGTTWVAEGAGAVQGFLTMRKDGHLDLFFVRPAWRRAGLADALYEAALSRARSDGLTRLTTHASLLARSFLSRRGWQVVTEERAIRNGVALTRFEMRIERI